MTRYNAWQRLWDSFGDPLPRRPVEPAKPAGPRRGPRKCPQRNRYKGVLQGQRARQPLRSGEHPPGLRTLLASRSVEGAWQENTVPARKPASEAGSEAARRTMTRLNARRRRQDGNESSASPPDSGTAPSSAAGSEASPTGVTARFDRVPKSELHHGASEGRKERSDAQSAGVPAAEVAR
jgi:hypothetical protein